MKMKTAAIYGDSISTRECGNGCYEIYLKRDLGIETVYNHAIGASALTDGTYCNLIRLLDDEANLHDDVDLVILWHGTNDWYWGARIGVPGTSDMEDESTYVGALNHAVRKIRAAAPGAKLLSMTPLWRREKPDGCETAGEAWNHPNKLGHTLREYCQALQAMGQILDFPVLDIRTLTNFDASTALVCQPDNVHPSAEGYRIIAGYLLEFLRNWEA